MFVNGWESLGRTALAGAITYASLIVLLRLSGKRTLARMNAFDLVVTVALGSTLATIALSSQVALVDGIAVLVLLVLFQFVVSWLSVRSPVVKRLVRSEPSLLLYRGEFLRAAMRSQRVTDSEIRQAARSQGVDDLSTHAVVLETDGSLSVIPASGGAGVSTLDELLGGRQD
jgi:uncharacterized membrane protein YcaP (DUF421 family)